MKRQQVTLALTFHINKPTQQLARVLFLQLTLANCLKVSHLWTACCTSTEISTITPGVAKISPLVVTEQASWLMWLPNYGGGVYEFLTSMFYSMCRTSTIIISSDVTHKKTLLVSQGNSTVKVVRPASCWISFTGEV